MTGIIRRSPGRGSEREREGAGLRSGATDDHAAWPPSHARHEAARLAANNRLCSRRAPPHLCSRKLPVRDAPPLEAPLKAASAPAARAQEGSAQEKICFEKFVSGLRLLGLEIQDSDARAIFEVRSSRYNRDLSDFRPTNRGPFFIVRPRGSGGEARQHHPPATPPIAVSPECVCPPSQITIEHQSDPLYAGIWSSVGRESSCSSLPRLLPKRMRTLPPRRLCGIAYSPPPSFTPREP